MSMADRKRTIRKEVLSRRKTLPKKEWVERSAIIADRVVHGIDRMATARHVFLYLCITSSREVCTGELAATLAGSARSLSVPIVREGRLFAAKYVPGEPLGRGLFGQPEPVSVRPVEAATIDVAILPLVAVDQKGCRLGYGKGYFDRFLASLAAAGNEPCRIGLAFSLQIVPSLPCDRWDEPLDYAVHENGIMRFTKQ